TLLNGRSIYHTSPDYLAQYARELLDAGVTLIGACCGSTPAHIRAMKQVMEEFRRSVPVERQPRSRPAKSKPATRAKSVSGGQPVPARVAGSTPPEADDRRSRFARNLGKKFLVTVELDIPRGLDMTPVVEGARYLRQCDIDAINITDGARARLRLSPIAISSMVQSQTGIEAMTHLATRDRNMISLQSELMSAHTFGLRNILCITGDPTGIGDYPQATSVFDIDSSGLIRAARAMNRGVDLMGNSIEDSTAFLIACAANPMADNLDAEIAKLARKVDAGADVIFTQPIYEMQTLERFLDRIHQWSIPLILGVLPLRSHKHAEFLHNEIPGMVIPKSIRERLQKAGEGAPEAGIDIAISFLSSARPLVAGAYLMPPFKKYDIVPRILESAGIRGKGDSPHIPG
ncbi:MAG: methylenetetrahydrofolate reductase, partial [Bacteroidota bacterium]